MRSELLAAPGGDANSAILEAPKQPDYSSIYADCFEAREEFLKTANEYLTKNGQQPLTLDSSQNWDEVLVSVTSACDTLEGLAAKDKEVKGFAGRMKKAYRTLCDNAGIGAGVINLIPSDQMYTAALCGGLKVIFAALQNAGYQRQAVYQALEDLPMILNDRAASIEIFSEDEELHRRMAALYVATLTAYRHILKYFIGNQFKAGLKHLLPSTNEKLKGKIKDVESKAEKFKERALVLLQKRQHESMILQNESAVKQNQALELTKRVVENTEKLLGDNGELKELIETLKNLGQQMVYREQKPRKKALPAPATGPSIEEYLRTFEYEPDLVFEDCQHLINLRQNQNSLDDAKILFIIQSPTLRNWLLQPTSTALLINGRSQSPQKPETSFFAAKLYASLFSASGTYGNMIALSFYCGQHRDERTDPNANPIEMLMSLLLQLLDNYASFKPAPLQTVLATLNPLDIHSVIQTFLYLVTKLGKDTLLFIILDGISFFTSPAQRGGELCQVMTALLGLVKGQKTRAIVKMVFTSPTRAREVEDLLTREEEEILDVAREVGQKSQYKESRWEDLSLLTEGQEVGDELIEVGR
jgi:hypothetical protein